MNMCTKVLICITSLFIAVRCNLLNNQINDIRNTKLASGRYKGWTAISTNTNMDENTKRRSWYEDTSFPSLPEQQRNTFTNSEYQPNNLPTAFDDSSLTQDQIGDYPDANNYDLPISEESLNTNEVISKENPISKSVVRPQQYSSNDLKNGIPSKLSQASPEIKKLAFSNLDSPNKQNSGFKPSDPIPKGFTYQSGTFGPFNHDQLYNKGNPEYQTLSDQYSEFIESRNPQFLNFPKQIPTFYPKIPDNKLKFSHENEIKLGLPTDTLAYSQKWNHQRLKPFTPNSDIAYYNFPPFNTQSQFEPSSRIPNTQFSTPSNLKYPFSDAPISFTIPWASTNSKPDVKLPANNKEWLKSFGWSILNTEGQDYKPKLTPNKKELWITKGWNDYPTQKRRRLSGPNVKYFIIKTLPRNEKLIGFARRSSNNMLHRSFWR